jgi:sporulation protein YlmC with PRC-barrel domain
MEYIEKFEGDKVFLKISPVTKLVGKKVKDSNGHDVGKIVEVIRVGETNVLEEIVVKTKIMFTKEKGAYEHEDPLPGEKKPIGEVRTSIESPLTAPSSDVDSAMYSSNTETFKEDITIPAKYIDSIGDNIQLNVTKEELIAQIF